MSEKKAIVLLSGGLDSATSLAMAKAQGYDCFALTVDYGQRHHAELQAAGKVAKALGAISHKVVRVNLDAIGGSALTDDHFEVPTERSQGIPITYVPARNTIFLSIALGYGEVTGARTLVVGANVIDYSGYPDCRPEYHKAFENLANLATKAGVEGNEFTVFAPLIDMSKGQIIQTGTELGVDYSMTVSCYASDERGRACGECDSCHFRKEGFEAAGVPDTTVYVTG